jgi:serine/threonine-protein kinase HipA
MPKREGLFEFPALPRATYHGLPGMLWDSLPDHFGRRLIERYF